MKHMDFKKSPITFTARKNGWIVAIVWFEQVGCFMVFGTQEKGGAYKSPVQALAISLNNAFEMAEGWISQGVNHHSEAKQ